MPLRFAGCGLSISGDFSHIRRMAKTSMQKTSGKQAGDRERSGREPRPRGNAVTDYLDASEPLHRGGFEESPQPELSGTPLTGSVSDWAEQIVREAEKAPSSGPSGHLLPDGEKRVHDVAASTSSPHRGEGGSRREPGEGALKPKSSKRIPERSSAPTKTARGTSMGGAASARDRAAAGLNPVAGLDISLEDAESLSNSGVTATVAALSRLIESGNPLHKNGQLWTPHRPERPEKSEGGIALKMISEFQPAGDQPTAIKDLVEGVGQDDRTQVLLGVTGSGKTFTMAKVIEETQRPALILAPNKTSRGPALWRVQEVLSGECSRVFRQLL